MVKRPTLANAGDEEFDPSAELDSSFVPEGNPEGNDTDQDIADQEAAGVAPAPTRPTAHAQGNGSNSPRTVSPKAQFNKLKADVFKLGALHGGAKTSMIALAETVTEAAMEDAITVEQVPDIYDSFKKGATKASVYEDAGEVSDEAAMGMAPAKSIEQQLSKLRQFVILGNRYQSDALDLIRKARNMHIELLRAANGDAEVKKGIKPGSTYSVLVDVARLQLKKQKEAIEAGKKSGVKHVGLAPLATDTELRDLMTQEVKETIEKTGEDYLLDTLNKAKATYRGSKTRNAITSDELANAIEWLRQALAKADPDMLAQHDAEEAKAVVDAQQAAHEKAERERLKAEQAAQPKPSKAERQAALAQNAEQPTA